MMMIAKRRAVWILTAVIGLSATGMGAWAVQQAAKTQTQPEQGQRPLARFMRARFGSFMALRGELNLTDDQKTQVRQIVKSHRVEIVPAARDVVTKGRALRQAVVADKPDEAAIRAAADALGKSIGDAAVIASKVKGEIKAVLTPEQQERLRKFREEREQSVDTLLNDVQTHMEEP